MASWRFDLSSVIPISSYCFQFVICSNLTSLQSPYPPISLSVISLVDFHIFTFDTFFNVFCICKMLHISGPKLCETNLVSIDVNWYILLLYLILHRSFVLAYKFFAGFSLSNTSSAFAVFFYNLSRFTFICNHAMYQCFLKHYLSSHKNSMWRFRKFLLLCRYF